MSSAWLQCIDCEAQYDLNELRFQCDCQGLLNVERDPADLKKISTVTFDKRLGSLDKEDQSGVWRFREAVAPFSRSEMICHPEGRTGLYQRNPLSEWADLEHLWIKHEGENPTGSFKDRGMTVAVSQAKRLHKSVIACASTGNTSASLASYAAHSGAKAMVFIPEGKISHAKLSQALAYGATCVSIQGDFDKAMSLVQDASKELGIYMVNSLNPFRIEGQKTIIWDILQGLKWKAPDWIITPGGNLGNTSAFGKAIKEALSAGWIRKMPRLVSVQAEGASPFYHSFRNQFSDLKPMIADTIASAIRIGNPVNFPRATKAITGTNGLVEMVSDQEILNAKFVLDRSGLGCEPASACSLAGLKKLRSRGVIQESESAVCILTGHILKDSETTMLSVKEGQSGQNPVSVSGTIDDIRKILNCNPA